MLFLIRNADPQSAEFVPLQLAKQAQHAKLSMHFTVFETVYRSSDSSSNRDVHTMCWLTLVSDDLNFFLSISIDR